MKESEVENYLVWAVEVLGGAAWKFKSPSQRGVADRIVCMPNGETWFIELKRPKGGRLSPLQIKFLEKVIGLQQKYALLINQQEIDKWLNDYRMRCSTRSCTTST